jgi:signal transduction histidine kinase
MPRPDLLIYGQPVDTTPPPGTPPEPPPSPGARLGSASGSGRGPASGSWPSSWANSWPGSRAGGVPPWRAAARVQRRPRAFLPILVLMAQVLGSNAAGHGEHVVRALDPLGYALLVVGPVALLARQRFRPAVVVVTVVAAGAYFTLGYPKGPGFLAALVAVFGAVRTGHRALSWAAAGVAYLGWACAGRLLPSVDHLARPGLGEVVLVGAWLLVAFAVADFVRVRSAHFAEVMRARAEEERARAEQRRARAEQERRQVSEERLRIARELHDVLGHHLSLINVQAGVGLHLIDERPEQARASLAAIKQASAEALREVRAVLAALHADDEVAPRTPAPTLSANLPTLVADVTAAGLPLDVDVSGEAHGVPAEVDRAAYRIVQEALTNVRRHAGTGARATVRVTYGPQEVWVRVLDDGTDGSTVDGNGSGIAGMRARTEALGGTFGAGPREGGAGFEVSARLPVGVP